MMNFYLVAYLEFANGQIKSSEDMLGFSSRKEDLDGLKRMIRRLIHNDAAAVTILNVQELSQEQYISLGGKLPAYN